MKIALAFGWLPIILLYRSKKSMGWAAGRMVYVFFFAWIEIAKGHESDKGLIEHELQHIEDLYRNFVIGYYLKRKNPEGRLAFEAAAYARQYIVTGQSKALHAFFVGLMIDKYKLNQNKSEIIRAFNLEIYNVRRARKGDRKI